VTDYAELVRYEGTWTLERWIIRIQRWGSILFLSLIVALVVTQVVTRYVLADPPLWTEEFARYALVWLAFLGAGWLVAINDHLTVHGLDMALSTRGKVILDMLVQLVQGAVAVVVLLNAPDFLRRVSLQHSAAGGLSMAWVYGSVAVGFALILLHSVLITVKDVLALTGRGDLRHLDAHGVPAPEDTEIVADAARDGDGETAWPGFEEGTR
jgi:TRAP-type C4-dicarboxylate transport system, small permease component